MTTTTKIFVILVCLFSFIFTPMAILFAARSENWKASATQYLDQARVAAAREQSAQSLLNAREADWSRQSAEYQKRLLESQQRIAELDRRIVELTQARDTLQQAHALLETQTSVLSAEVASSNQQNKKLSDARETALARERELQTANAVLNDQLQLRMAEVDVLKQQLNQRQQEMLACRQENEDLRKGQGLGKATQPLTAGPSGNVEALTPAASSKITGKVKQLRGNMVSIDVGSSSGVQEGMKMIVRRGGSYIADIRITSVSPGEAIGEITLLGPEGKQVRGGDDVIDEASFVAG
ncbi:MAG: hypothetical protein IT428_10740 [Planctomycetaceae bacterium]|nr:hypothetical protein [Planctomycetaceae bacterium]